MRHRPIAIPALTIAAILAIAGCSQTGASSPPAATTEAPTASASPSEEPSPSAEESSPAESMAAGATVMIADSDFGQILVDAEGRTLYGFIPDEASGEPTCYDQCATNWPPLLAEDEVTVGEGLDDSDFSLVPRTDGGMQVKIGEEYPLYYFANDSAAGDTNGQGIGGNWYVVGPDGELIKS